MGIREDIVDGVVVGATLLEKVTTMASGVTSDGASDGANDSSCVGVNDGESDGNKLVMRQLGVEDGPLLSTAAARKGAVGSMDGTSERIRVGVMEGVLDGNADGDSERKRDGESDGSKDG